MTHGARPPSCCSATSVATTHGASRAARSSTRSCATTLRPRRHAEPGRRSERPAGRAHLRRLEGAVVHRHRRSAQYAQHAAASADGRRRRNGLPRPAHARRAQILSSSADASRTPARRSAPPGRSEGFRTPDRSSVLAGQEGLGDLEVAPEMTARRRDQRTGAAPGPSRRGGSAAVPSSRPWTPRCQSDGSKVPAHPESPATVAVAVQLRRAELAL